jgi:Glycosyl transferase family group 2
MSSHPSTDDCNAGAPCRLGVVVIGRNEGGRLASCLASVSSLAERTVYVDSGSSDDSVSLSRSRGIATLELDRGTPFTAARARNEGFELLCRLHPDVEYVQFVDGDCELAQDWPQQAARFICRHPHIGIVWGGQREKFPRHSLYNRLCDLEWQQAPMGETLECGGNALVRVAALQQVGGYRGELICGEEPELCLRLRRAGWRIWRIEAPMTLHDAAMDHFRQWWRRMRRGGYAFAQGAHLHGAAPERLWVSQSCRAWGWGLCLPAAVACGTVLYGYPALLLLVAYPLQIMRIALRARRWSADSWLHATALVLAKFPELLGQLSFLTHTLSRAQARLIEYK